MKLAKYEIRGVINELVFKDGDFYVVNPNSGKRKKINIKSYIYKFLVPKENKIKFLEDETSTAMSKEELVEKIKEVLIEYYENKIKKILNVKKIYEIKTWSYYDREYEDKSSAFGYFTDGETIYYYKIKTEKGTFLIIDEPLGASLHKVKWDHRNNKWVFLEDIEIEPKKITEIIEAIQEIENVKKIVFKELSKEEIKKLIEKEIEKLEKMLNSGLDFGEYPTDVF